MNASEPITLGGLVDLAADAIGGTALACSDDFFAEMQAMLRPGRGRFDPEAYTERGKWMDGWESMRTRSASALPDRDECIVRLGARGTVRGLDIDTNHFLGNHPPFASVAVTVAPWDAVAGDLVNATWTTILPPSPLRPGSQNLFAVDPTRATHVKLTIYPDGGVARFRVYGEVDPDSDHPRAIDGESAERITEGERELAGVAEGGRAVACSDMFFSPMNNLILPGRATRMDGGWETRRRRTPGHDWITVRLARVAELGMLEVDTAHFKGNYPDACSVEGVLAPDAGLIELTADALGWTPVLPRSPLGPDARHWFRDQLAARGPFSHLRLHIFPDGGVSRLRVWGRPA